MSRGSLLFFNRMEEKRHPVDGEYTPASGLTSALDLRPGGPMANWPMAARYRKHGASGAVVEPQECGLGEEALLLTLQHS